MYKPVFVNLWNNFPDHISYPNMKALYTWLGGVIEKNIAAPGFGENGNTCASRLSVAFNKAGAPINKTVAASIGTSTISAGDNSQIIYRVEDFRKYLYKTLGKPTLDHTSPFDSDIRGKRGIIAFKINFIGATGHIALWNGSIYREPGFDNYATYLEGSSKTSQSEFWELP